MAELLTAAGIVFILVIGAWYLGSALLRRGGLVFSRRRAAAGAFGAG